MTDATLCQNYAFMLELCQLCFYAFMPKAMLASSGKANLAASRLLKSPNSERLIRQELATYIVYLKVDLIW